MNSGSSVFVDTSALFALLDADDQNHGDAVARWRELKARETSLATTAYVAVEAFALVQRRLSQEAVRALAAILGEIRLEMIDKSLHQAGLTAFLAAGRGLSLVDCVSFEYMRREGLGEAFAYDADFERAGFRA